MILNAFLEGVIAIVMGVGLCVGAHYLATPELDTFGKMLLGAGAGYVLRELGTAK